MLTKLQLYVQQVNTSLEETSQNVVSSMPKLLRDTQILQQEAIALKEKMQTVKGELEAVIPVFIIKFYMHAKNFFSLY